MISWGCVHYHQSGIRGCLCGANLHQPWSEVSGWWPGFHWLCRCRPPPALQSQPIRTFMNQHQLCPSVDREVLVVAALEATVSEHTTFIHGVHTGLNKPGHGGSFSLAEGGQVGAEHTVCNITAWTWSLLLVHSGEMLIISYTCSLQKHWILTLKLLFKKWRTERPKCFSLKSHMFKFLLHSHVTTNQRKHFCSCVCVQTSERSRDILFSELSSLI